MEEFDSILMSQLREIGCDFFDEDADGIGSLDSHQLMKCIAVCLHRMPNPVAQDGVPNPNTIIPAMNMSIKYKIAQQLAAGVQNAGYKSDLDFSTILYSNVPQIRRLLLWLVEQIAAEQDDKPLVADQDDDTRPDNILGRLKRIPINTVWLPGTITDDVEDEQDDDDDDRDCWPVPKRKTNDPVIHRLANLNMSIKSFISGGCSEPLKRYAQTEGVRIFPRRAIDILEWNNHYWKNRSAELAAGHLDTDLLKFYLERPDKQKSLVIYHHQQSRDTGNQDTSSLSSELENNSGQAVTANQPKSQTLLNDQEIILEQLRQQLRECEEQIAELRSQDQELARKEKEYQEKCKQLEADYKTKQELEKGIQAMKESIKEIDKTWNEMQAELIKNLKDKKMQNMAQNEEQVEKVKNINALKKSISSKLKEIQAKEALIAELQSKVPHQWPPGRSSYTRRILEIIQNVKRQDEETVKVVLETKTLHKDINNLNGKIERSFAVAEDVLFREAKQNEWDRKCYKCLASLQSAFGELLLTIGEIGAHLREIRRLEEMIETERNRKAGSNLARINADLEQIRLENQQLRQMIQQQLLRLNQKQPQQQPVY